MKIMHSLIPILLIQLCCLCTTPEPDVIPPPPDDTPIVNPGDETPKPPVNPVDPSEVPAGEGYVVVGYATYWDSTMPDPSLLTHINYAFAHINKDFETLDIKNESRLARIAALKQTNKDLKVQLSVGGWEAGNFSEMAADATHRKNFCTNCLAAVKKYNLDGIDIDWEYPTSNAAGISSSPNDTKNFTLLIKDLRETLGADMLVTMASSANAKYVDFKSLVKYMDFVNIMTYDMGKPPYHNAGLYKSAKTKRSCDESVALHLAAGVPYEKMVLGIPFYGHGNGVEFTTDCVDFNEIKFAGYSRRWDDDAKVPYLVNSSGTMVLSYDDGTSVGLKAEYIKEKGLRGAMYWNIEADDSNWTLSKAIAGPLLGWTPPASEAFLATNQYVQKFLEEVDYGDSDYTYSKVIGYPGGGPSTDNCEVPPTYTVSWTAASTGQKLLVWEGDMAKDYELTYFSPSEWGMSKDDNGNPVYKHTRDNYSYGSVRKTIYSETSSGTYQERIAKYLVKIGVPQTDIDDLRKIMLK